MENIITIIQGDTYECEVTVEGIVAELVDKIYFSSNQLNVCKMLDKRDNKFILKFTPEETMKFSTGNLSYDFTIYFLDNTIQTAQYKARISILPKINKVQCNV